MVNKRTKGGLPARLGVLLHERIFVIIRARLRNNPEDKISLEKITNLIVRNKHWKDIEEDIINLTEEELQQWQ